MAAGSTHGKRTSGRGDRVNAALLVKQRKKLGWGQEELAGKAGLNERTIQKLESTGRGDLETIRKVNEALRDAFAKDTALAKIGYLDIRIVDDRPVESQLLPPTPMQQQPASAQPFGITPSVQDSCGLVNREEAYERVAGLLEAVLDGRIRKREVYLAALHSLSEMRAKTEGEKFPPKSPAIQRFDSAMMECVRSRGANRVYVRLLFSIFELDRLNQIERRIKSAGDADGFEVKAFCLRQAIPLLTPLIVGNEDAFLAVDEPAQYRVKCGLHLHGRDEVAIIMEYWNTL